MEKHLMGSAKPFSPSWAIPIVLLVQRETRGSGVAWLFYLFYFFLQNTSISRPDNDTNAYNTNAKPFRDISKNNSQPRTCVSLHPSAILLPRSLDTFCVPFSFVILRDILTRSFPWVENVFFLIPLSKSGHGKKVTRFPHFHLS